MKNKMRSPGSCLGKHGCVPLLAFILLINSCAPSLQKIGREQGCRAAEERLQAYIVHGIKKERFKRNLPYRSALLPLSLTVGFLFNYLGEITYIIPLLAPKGFKITGSEIKALYFQEALTYSHFKGTRLDHLDDEVIARAKFDTGTCYYESENYFEASTYFEDLLESNYARYVGEENLLFLLGDCYYMLSLYDKSVNDYSRFLDYCDPGDERIPLVKSRIKTIEALYKKGLWGIEKEEERQ